MLLGYARNFKRSDDDDGGGGGVGGGGNGGSGVAGSIDDGDWSWG